MGILRKKIVRARKIKDPITTVRNPNPSSMEQFKSIKWHRLLLAFVLLATPAITVCKLKMMLVPKMYTKLKMGGKTMKMEDLGELEKKQEAEEQAILMEGIDQI